ncbi:hypothetical protein [Paenibacillus crassostreae]|uniref:Terpene synthase n=1 Tax=Paenibacillus crassostreae TaxID=1763538 RepID=A0A167GRU5_9BACL|nr:hypothetical protein [Paenibacillus crassostreae]AOZ92033.1 hypothetical protein LPB68_07235 [Paenibacillus crassostreae]OAB77842.1 hypothetical protein PNBC_00315 [Paenibacillus crassostreae]
MQWYKDFEKDIAQVFIETQQIVEKFPPPLNHKGLAYLSKFDIRQDDSTKNYICYLLPFWCNDISQLKKDTIVRLSVGNVLAMLYFFIQDDLMDSQDSLDRDQVPLANLLYIHFFEIYLAYFPFDSPFWAYFHQYIVEWTDGVANEPHEDYFQTDLIKIARKAAPLKLSSTAVLLLSNQSNLVFTASDMIDHVLVTLQMADDWNDWEDDYTENNYNGLISLIRFKHDQSDIISIEEIKRAIFVQDIMQYYTKFAISNHTYIEQLNLNLPYLLSFHHTLVNHLKRDAESINEKKRLQASGGLNYWLSKNIK